MKSITALSILISVLILNGCSVFGTGAGENIEVRPKLVTWEYTEKPVVDFDLEYTVKEVGVQHGKDRRD